MPSSKAEKKYNNDFQELFNAAQKALIDLDASIESTDENTGEIKSVKKFHLFKKAKFTIVITKSGNVSAESSMSALVMGAVDIGRNAKFIKMFFSNLDESIGNVQTEEKPSASNECETQEVDVQEPEEEEGPLAEYRETLHTNKKTATSKKPKSNSSDVDQRVWRDVDSIEKDVDTIHIRKAKKPVTEVDKKVDLLIEKNKEKRKRKPSNVIYVVSKPQPGEVKGDWAVRSHAKIFSHHKTKEKAIEEARKIAKKRDATVMVQNTDGTFSDGFKPRK